MNATDLLIWGIVVHLIVDWLGQNEWIAVNKAKRRQRAVWAPVENSMTGERWGRGVGLAVDGAWWDRHPAAYVHAALHGAAQLLVFPFWAALLIGLTHLLIDTRVPVEWWSRLIRQTQPDPARFPVMDIGAEVRIWADQVWHIVVLAIVALLVAP